MKPLNRFKVAVIKTLAAGLLLMPVYSASATDDVAVSIHAVNYSNQEFEYSIHDPKDKLNQGGGESISRFGAGGSMCCYSLPRKWRPDLKVRIDFNVYLPRRPDGILPKTVNSTLVDIPQYQQPQELWVVRDAEGAMVIVMSNFEPDHPKWPWKIKGWPVPSLAYKRERADLYIKLKKDDIRNSQELSDEMRSAPEKTAKRSWEFSMEYDKKSLVGFTGYKDKKFQKFLINDFEKTLAEDKEILKKLQAGRP